MRIIVKFVLKNIWEKKLRTFLIIFSIMISSALFFASVTLGGTMEKLYLQRLKSNVGTAEIVIREGDKSPSPYFSFHRIDPYRGQTEYAVGVLQGTAFYKDKNNETIRISMLGVDWDTYQLMNPITLYDEKNMRPFAGRKAVISKDTADMYGIQLGDSIELEINGTRQRYYVCALSQLCGPFEDTTNGICAIVPKEALSNMHNEAGKVSALYIKLKDPQKKQEIIEDLAHAFNYYSVSETISMESINRRVKPMKMAFLMTSIIAFLMSAFIIYSSFKVITAERLPVIGTFRSIGATKGVTNKILLAESLSYGLVGGALGGCMGIVLLYIIATVSNPQTVKGTGTSLEFSMLQLSSSVFLAVTLSFLSSIIPIINVSRIPIRDIVLNNVQKVNRKKIWKLIAAAVFAAAVITAPPFIPKGAAMVANTICIILSIVAIVFSIPFITNGFIKIFKKTYGFIFGNEGILAVQNLQDNKILLNNVTLLAIGVSCILMINTISYSVIEKLTDTFAEMKYDIYFEMSGIDRSAEKQLKSFGGITSTYGVYVAEDVNVTGSNTRIGALEGIDKNKHLEYFNLKIADGNEDMFNELDSGRNIILNSSLGYEYNKKIGDTIILELGKGKREYKIIGFISTLIERGSYAIISENYFKMDMGEQHYGYILIKTNNDPEGIVTALKKKYAVNKPSVISLKEDSKKNIKSNEQIFSVLKGFSVFTIIMGILGVFNNFIIGFIERKRSLAVLRSIGASKKQIVKMIFIESLTGGSIGGFIGVTGGILMTSVFPYIMNALNMPVSIAYSTDILIISVLTSMIISVVVSISPAVKSSRLNIIESIKYE